MLQKGLIIGTQHLFGIEDKKPSLSQSDSVTDIVPVQSAPDFKFDPEGDNKARDAIEKSITFLNGLGYYLTRFAAAPIKGAVAAKS